MLKILKSIFLIKSNANFRKTCSMLNSRLKRLLSVVPRKDLHDFKKKFSLKALHCSVGMHCLSNTLKIKDELIHSTCNKYISYWSQRLLRQQIFIEIEPYKKYQDHPLTLPM